MMRSTISLLLLVGLAALVAPAHAINLTIDAPSCVSWSLAGSTLTCSASAPTSGTPSSCAVSPASITVPAGGGSVSISAGCSGTPATSWNWSVAGSSSTTSGNSVTYSGSVTPPVTIVATPSNGAVTGSPFTIPVTAAASGGGGGGGAISCAGFNHTYVLDANWATPARLVSAMSPNDIVVVRFTTGSNASPQNNLPKFVAAEYASAPSARVASLSSTACSFTTTLGGIVNNATTVTMPFSVGPNSTGFYPALAPNTTYYLNIKNGSSPSCASNGACDLYVDLLKPGSGY